MRTNAALYQWHSTNHSCLSENCWCNHIRLGTAFQLVVKRCDVLVFFTGFIQPAVGGNNNAVALTYGLSLYIACRRILPYHVAAIKLGKPCFKMTLNDSLLRI